MQIRPIGFVAFSEQLFQLIFAPSVRCRRLTLFEERLHQANLEGALRFDETSQIPFGALPEPNHVANCPLLFEPREWNQHALKFSGIDACKIGRFLCAAKEVESAVVATDNSS